MDKELNSLLTRLADIGLECTQLLEETEDLSLFESRLSRASTAFIKCALYFRTSGQETEEAVNDLLTDTFSEIVLVTKPVDTSQLKGSVQVHAPGTLNPEGITLCRNWEVRYSTKAGPEHRPGGG